MIAMRMMTAMGALAAMLASAGCLNYSKPVKPQQAITTAERNYDALWQASQDVLRKYNFTIALVDRRAGQITTAPLTGRQWFEFWRHDAATYRDLKESSISTLYRTAKVQIRPTAKGAETYQVAVSVEISRPARSAVDVGSTSDAYAMFITPGKKERASQLEEYGLTEENPTPKADTPPYPIGTDEKLAQKLADAINEAAAKKLLGV